MNKKPVSYLWYGLFFLSSILAFVCTLPVALAVRWLRPAPDLANPKVFVGFHEVANNIYSIAHTLANHGYGVKAIIVKNKFYDDVTTTQRPNLTIECIERQSLRSAPLLYLFLPFRLIGYLWRFDVFMFVWYRTFFFLSLDTVLIRLAGRKQIFMHCGDDARYRPMQRAIDASFGYETLPDAVPNPLIFLLRFYWQRLSEWTGDVISTRDLATFQKGPLYQFRFAQPSLSAAPRAARDKPLILHCPSDRVFKGTAYVLDAIELLRQRGLEFDFELIENSPNSYVLERLKEADILIDQPNYWAARVALEAMSNGCCVVGANWAEYYQRTPSPILQFEKDAVKLADVLEKLIHNQEYRESKMRECYDYWKNQYSEEGYFAYFRQLLDGTLQQFYPLANHKELLLQGATNRFERRVVEWFY